MKVANLTITPFARIPKRKKKCASDSVTCRNFMFAFSCVSVINLILNMNDACIYLRSPSNCVSKEV